MLGILFKLLTTSFPFLKDMLFGRSATGRTRMISFLIICNLAMAISFFTTAKVTASLYVSDRKHKEEILALRESLVKANEAISKTKNVNVGIVEIVSAYTATLTQMREDLDRLKMANNKLENEVALYKMQKDVVGHQ